MKKSFIITVAVFIISLIASFSLMSQENNEKSNSKSFFVAKTAFGVLATDIKPIKIDAALTFTARATQGKYNYIPFYTLDSVYNSSKNENDTLTSLTLSEKLDADFFVYLRVNKLANILRVDISAIDSKDTNKKTYGVGYAAIRYKKLTTQEQMTDPALLMATMRAFALAVSDTTLFVQSDSLKILPVPTLVIGGINYIDDKELETWEIFSNKEISSYDAVENIFDEIKNTDKFAVFDIPTRDTLYSLFNLMMVENYRLSTSTELKILFNMDVQYFITGILTRMEQGALLDLFFCRILEGGKLEVIAKETNLVKDDTIIDYNDVLRKTIRALMDKNPQEVKSTVQ